jgi:hypothetical protein
LANGLPPVPESIHESFTFADGREEIKGREWILSGKGRLKLLYVFSQKRANFNRGKL